jgi:hypothetical protein
VTVPGAKYDEKADKRSWAAMKGFFAELFGDPSRVGVLRASGPPVSDVAFLRERDTGGGSCSSVTRPAR